VDRFEVFRFHHLLSGMARNPSAQVRFDQHLRFFLFRVLMPTAERIKEFDKANRHTASE